MDISALLFSRLGVPVKARKPSSSIVLDSAGNPAKTAL